MDGVAEMLNRMVDSHWWHVGRRRVVISLLRHHLNGGDRPMVFDVGCGVGDYGQALELFTRPIGFERSTDGLASCRTRGYRHLVMADARRLPAHNSSADALLALDLLEHVVEDEAVLQEYYRCLKPGGMLLVTVPAHPWMWSDLDLQFGHVRRYRRRELAHKIHRAGFQIIKLSYFNSLLFPAQAGTRLAQRMLKRWWKFDSSSTQSPRSATLNRVLAACFGAEANWLKVGRFPCGVSLICVAQKPEGAV